MRSPLPGKTCQRRFSQYNHYPRETQSRGTFDRKAHLAWDTRPRGGMQYLRGICGKFEERDRGTEFVLPTSDPSNSTLSNCIYFILYRSPSTCSDWPLPSAGVKSITDPALNVFFRGGPLIGSCNSSNVSINENEYQLHFSPKTRERSAAPTLFPLIYSSSSADA